MRISRATKVVFALLAVTVVCLCTVLFSPLLSWINDSDPDPDLLSTAPPTPVSPTAAAPTAAAMGTSENQPLAHLQTTLAALKSAASAADSRKLLADLRAYLDSLSPALAAAVMADFLNDPARDAPTRIEFAVGPNGNLSGHPSLRVALLDWLGTIDPKQAAAVARQILATPTAADEWAVCLRNCARANQDANTNDFLRTKTEELIRNPVWREEPSVGFLEAFDVLVHARATESSDLLCQLVSDKTPEGKALAHAAYLTLDRLTIREPAEMMEQLGARPELTESRGEMVANMFARADLREPAQQQLVRSYLLDPARTQQELRAFAGVYPNNNYAISNNLLSGNTTAQGADLAAHDRAALIQVTQWLNDPGFESVKPHIQTMHRRLTAFVGQAAR